MTTSIDIDTLRVLIKDEITKMLGRELRDLARLELARLSVPMADKTAFTTPEVMALTGLGRSAVFEFGRRGVGPLVRARGTRAALKSKLTLWTRESVEAFLKARGQTLVRASP